MVLFRLPGHCRMLASVKTALLDAFVWDWPGPIRADCVLLDFIALADRKDRIRTAQTAGAVSALRATTVQKAQRKSSCANQERTPIAREKKFATNARRDIFVVIGLQCLRNARSVTTARMERKKARKFRALQGHSTAKGKERASKHASLAPLVRTSPSLQQIYRRNPFLWHFHISGFSVVVTSFYAALLLCFVKIED